jgi:pseudouridine synthase, RluA family
MRNIIYNQNKPIFLRDFLKDNFPALSLKYIANSIKQKNVKVNNKPVTYNYKLQKQDEINIFFPIPVNNTSIEKQCKLPEIIYEDTDLIIFNKPAGLLVNGAENNTLINICKQYFLGKGDITSAENAHLCHRIDRGTCGLVMVAKTPHTHEYIYKKMQQHQIGKTYFTVVAGSPKQKNANLQAFLTKDAKNATVTVSSKPLSEKSRSIETQYTLLESKNGLSLLSINLITGRTHQIRAHLAHIGHPILGDGKYGDYAINKQYGLKYPALFAKALAFNYVQMPEDFPYSFVGNTFAAQDPWFIEAFRKNEW